METLKKHEIFEIELLEKLKNAGFLKPLVFSGGTMLRLCFELNRYSTDLDFRFIKKINSKSYFASLKKYLSGVYELTDAEDKYNTLLFEIRARDYPKRLKVEIRKGIKKCEYEERIAFSQSSAKQVILRVHTLQQVMRNKIEAALNRRDIRDFFDLEFLLRRGLPLKAREEEIEDLKKTANSFKANDFKVTLGSILDAETRKYYIKKHFDYFLSKI